MEFVKVFTQQLFVHPDRASFAGLESKTYLEYWKTSQKLVKGIEAAD